MLPEKAVKPAAWWLAAAVILSLICYYFLAYQTNRHDFDSLLTYFLVLFLVYVLVLRMVDGPLLPWALLAALTFRVLLLPALPELSDDFYRFIWDGRLLAGGISPFADLPSTLMEDPLFAAVPLNQHLYQNMNSPDYFTVYPPLAQWVFWLAAKLFPENLHGNVVVIRLVLLALEIGSVGLVIKILSGYQLPEKNVLIYAWNPLVIMELTGNLHFEAMMIFFVLLAIYGLQRNRWLISAVSMGAAVASKLIPLIFLPLLIKRLEWKKLIAYWMLCGITFVVLFLTLWDAELVAGMQSSLGLYFQKFEFNASIYYLVREIGYVIKGYNIIQQAGVALALVTFLFIFLLSGVTGKKNSWPQAMIWALTIYLLLATIVHPWYVAPLVALAVFTDYKFPIAWSLLVLLSYSGYTETGFEENMLLVIVEYLLLFLVMVWDLKHHLKSTSKARLSTD